MSSAVKPSANQHVICPSLMRKPAMPYWLASVCNHTLWARKSEGTG